MCGPRLRSRAPLLRPCSDCQRSTLAHPLGAQDEEGVFDPELVPSALPALFEEKDIRTMFSQFDVNGSGSISSGQCTKGALCLLAHPDHGRSATQCPSRWRPAALSNMGVEASEMPEISGVYTEDKFVAVASECMAKKTAL